MDGFDQYEPGALGPSVVSVRQLVRELVAEVLTPEERAAYYRRRRRS